MNLHALARGAIQAVKPDKWFTLYRSAGEEVTDARGITVGCYLPGVSVRGHVQTEGDAALSFSDHAGQNTNVRRIWLYADSDAARRPWAAWRPLSRAGDMITDEDGNQWFVDAVVDDFSSEGWVSLRVTLQTAPKPLVIKPPEEET